MGKQIKLLSGLDKDGNIVLIDDVKKSGLACECFAPDLKTRLIARMGNIRRHHFAQESVSNGTFSFMSSLHLSAQRFLKELGYMYIPPLKSLGRTSDKWSNIKIDDVILEHREGNYIPDVTIISEGKKLQIEILVTHKVDNIKKAKLYISDISTLEIDLSRYRQDEIDNDKLKEILSGIRPNEKYWVYNSAEHHDNVELITNALSEKPFTYTKISKIIGKETVSNFVTCPIGMIFDRWGWSFAKADRDCVNCPFNLLHRQDYLDKIKEEEEILNDIRHKLPDDKANALIDDFNKVRLGTIINNGYCICLGKSLIGCPEDGNIASTGNLGYRRILEEKYENVLHRGIKRLQNNQCPLCAKEHLMNKVNVVDGKYEHFLGCHDFLNDCRYTIKPSETARYMEELEINKGKQYQLYKNNIKGKYDLSGITYTQYLDKV